MKQILETLRRKWPEYLLEILVIIIGILAAFALNNWKEQNQQAQIEHSALIDLRQELQINLGKLEYSMGRHEGGIENSKVVLGMAREGKVDLEHFIPIHGLNTINPALGVIDKLTATAKIDYIHNDSLKNLLSEWKDQILDLKENEDRHIDFVMRQIRPIEDELLLFSGLARNERYNKYNFYTKKEIQSKADAAIRNPLLINKWLRNLQLLSNINVESERLRTKLKTMLRLLEEEIPANK